jgi:16S rRNA (adenine1518-N6/adenine1519-N6)-dimethyltransferase
MERLGQHFLKDEKALRKIAEALTIKAGEKVIEIGPGHGELTRELVRLGAKVTAIEKDGLLATDLEKKFGENIRVVTGDALKLLPELASGEKYKLTGNIPYYITGFLLRTIGELDPKPDLTVLMIQKEVAERLIDKPPRMNRLSASVGFWAEAKLLFNVPKKSFLPPPRVDSAVVLLGPKPEGGDQDAYYSLIRALFKQPRKTIWNNLRDGGFKDVDNALKEGRINPQDRPQNLDIEDIINLSKILKNSA